MKLLAALLLVASSVATAAADSGSASSSSSATSATASDLAAQDCARAHRLHKQCVLTFGTEEIGGKVVAPDGIDVAGGDIATFSSLIRLRADFRAEIIKAAEDL